MGEPTDDEPTASSSTSAPRGDSIAAAASRALRAKKVPAAAETTAAAPAATTDTPPATGAKATKATKPPKPTASAAPATTATPAKPATTAQPAKPATTAQPAKPPAASSTTKIEKPATPAKPAVATTTSAIRVAKPAAAAAAAGDRTGSPWLGRRALLIYALVAALMVAAAVITGVLAATTKQNSDLAFNDTRNQVVVDATKDIQTLNALDYRTAAAGINAWLEVSTGSLHDDVTAQRTAILSEVAQKKTVTSAQVLSLAVTQLDDRSGSATVMTSVEQIVTPAGQAAVKKFDRFAADLIRVDGSWRIQSITLVPV